ncbi:PQQ-binding-like beta-propeller repeat protein [bacterium]|nr:PQQ-binding-like beta-propeller repeat protein [bacterium]
MSRSSVSVSKTVLFSLRRLLANWLTLLAALASLPAEAAEPMRLEGHAAAVYDVAWLPNGQSLVSASFDQTLKLWDVPSSTVLRTMDGHTGIVLCVAVSPDGTLIASGASDSSIRLWEVPQNDPTRTIRAHDGESRAIALSPDGKTLATADATGAVRLFEIATGTQQKEVKLPAPVSSLAWSRNGQLLGAGCDDGGLHLMNPQDGKVTVSVSAHAGRIAGLEFSTNNSLFFTAGEDGFVRHWPVNLKAPDDGSRLMKDAAQAEHVADEKAVHGFALLSNGAQYATAGEDGQVKIWNASNGAPASSASGFEGAALCVALSPDRRQIAAGGADGTVRCWNLSNGSSLFRHTVGQPVKHVAFSPDNSKLVAATADQTISVFDATPLNPQPAEPPSRSPAQSLKLKDAPVAGFVWEADSRTLHSLAANGSVATWTVSATGSVATLSGHRGPVYALKFSPDGRTLASGSNDKTVRLWEVETRKATKTLSTQDAGIYSVAWTPGGDQLVTAGADNSVRLLDVSSSREIRSYSGPEFAVYSASISADGKSIAAGGMGVGEQRLIRLWDVDSSEPRTGLAGHRDDVYRVEFSPDGGRLLSIGYSGEFRVWDLGSGKPVLEQSVGQVSYSAAFSPNGKNAAVALSDGSVLLIEVP